MTNEDRLGEFCKFYWLDGVTDLDQPDATLLFGFEGWMELCVTNLAMPVTRSLKSLKDRCGYRTDGHNYEVFVPGRREVSVEFELYQLRIPGNVLKQWHEASDMGKIISALILNDDRTDPSCFGWVGNFLVEDDGREEPQSGGITVSYVLRPAAEVPSYPPLRRIYAF